MTGRLVGLVGAITALWFTVAAVGQEPREQRFRETETKVLAEAAQRHLRLGNSARKQGLVAQATAQFLRGQEVGEGRNPGAEWLVSVMRGLDEAFWSNAREPSGREVEAFRKLAANLDRADRKDWLGLAEVARKFELDDIALGYYRKVLRESGAQLEFDKDGRIVVPEVGKIPAEFAERLSDGTIEIDGHRRLRDPMLAELDPPEHLFEVADGELLVQCETSEEQAGQLHRILVALLPKLELHVGDRPYQQLRVYVFATRERFLTYLDRTGYGATEADGLCDYSRRVALVCAEERPPSIVQAIALHELTHLFDYLAAPTVFPSWYAEGFAEWFGGEGSFRFEDGELSVGGDLPEHRLEPLLAEGGLMPLREMLVMDGSALLRHDRESAIRFYAQAWAFVRYLKTGAPEDVVARFRIWERRCRGMVAGSGHGEGRPARDERPAGELFLEMFGPQLDALETGFAAWLRR